MDFTSDTGPRSVAISRVSFVLIVILGVATLGSVCCFKSSIESLIGGIIAAAIACCVFSAIGIRASRKK